MKKPIHRLAPLLAGASVGFTAAIAFGKIMSAPGKAATPGHTPAALVSSSTGPVMVSPGGTTTAFKGLPSAETFRSMSAQAKVRLAASFGPLTPAQREAALQECAAWPAGESTPMLCLLLSRWAETDPALAAQWCFRHLGERALNGYHDVARIWASQDGPGLAAWAAHYLTKEDAPFSMGVRIQTPLALARFDPVAAAQFLELDCDHEFTRSGLDFSSSLRTPEAVKAMASRLPGHVEYISDLEELNRQFAGKSRNPRNRPSKNGWNALFDQTAVALHRLSPEECGAWLATFPENTQLVARHEIAKKAAPAPHPSH